MMLGSRNVRVLYIWPAGGPVVSVEILLALVMIRPVPCVVITNAVAVHYCGFSRLYLWSRFGASGANCA